MLRNLLPFRLSHSSFQMAPVVLERPSFGAFLRTPGRRRQAGVHPEVDQVPLKVVSLCQSGDPFNASTRRSLDIWSLTSAFIGYRMMARSTPASLVS